METIETRIQKAKQEKLKANQKKQKELKKSLSERWDLLKYGELVDLLAE